MPLHTGHMRLFDFAQAYVDMLTILVCSRPIDPIPGELRFQWVAQMYPGCRVRHFAESADPVDLDDPGFWDQWRTNIRSIHPEPLNYLVTSEVYGRLLSDKLGTHYIKAPDRDHVSGTDIRADPFGCWYALPAVVRPYYAQRVCVSAADPGRGRDLGIALAACYQTEFVERYEPVDALDFNLARGQEAANQVGALRANRVFFVAGDAFTLSDTHSRSEERRPADLYLVDLDQGVGATGQAGHGDILARRFVANPQAHFPDLKVPPIEVVGGTPTESLRRAIAAIDLHLPKLSRFVANRAGTLNG
jgi:hypothetical protein